LKNLSWFGTELPFYIALSYHNPIFSQSQQHFEKCSAQVIRSANQGPICHLQAFIWAINHNCIFRVYMKATASFTIGGFALLEIMGWVESKFA